MEGRKAAGPYREVVAVKAIILLAIAIFLAAAPEPDSEVIAELSAHFFVIDSAESLQASEAPSEEK